MGNVIGQPLSFYKKFKFVVEIDNVKVAAFQKCGELAMEIAKIEQWQGGVIIPDKSPGRVTFPDFTLERGATDDVDLFNWAKEVADAAANQGLVDAKYKRNLDIVQQDRDGKTLRRWRVVNAWPVKFVAGEWDNGADENVMESVTLTFDTFDIAPKGS